MKKKINTDLHGDIASFPDGWSKGDTCVMITNKAKKTTCEYTIEDFAGAYFLVRSRTGSYFRASPGRLFRTREDAVESLKEQKQGGMTLQ